MLEIFVAEFFIQSKPVWIDDLGTKNKLNIVLAISAAALKFFCFVLLRGKKRLVF